MPLDVNGQWYPPLSPKQLEVYNDPRKHQLLSGPRVCGKTIVAVHKAIKHAWLHQNDRVGIFVKSAKIGRVGIWDDLITYALPLWVEGLGDDGFKILVGPAIDGATRMYYVRIANRHGGESEIQLHSLHHDDSVHEKLKGSRFGCFLFDELDNYDNEEVFNVSTMQLRQIGLSEDKHLWLGTCNPAGDQDHWIYQKFWVDINNETIDMDYRKTFKTWEFTLRDNPYIEESTISKLKAIYKDNPEMYDRYVNGLWVPDMSKSHFGNVFKQALVKGSNKEGTGLLPTDGCMDIFVGVDLGDRNHAVVFLENVRTSEGNYWAVIDELVSIGQDKSIQEVTDAMVDKMKELETLHGKPLKFTWWSDRSAFDRYRSAADAKDHILVHRFSEGKIELFGCPKPKGSVEQRIQLVRRFLFENKLYFSANCTATIDAIKKLSRGKTKGELIKRNGHIHPFDALSYALYAECIAELEDSLRPKIVERPEIFALG